METINKPSRADRLRSGFEKLPLEKQRRFIQSDGTIEANFKVNVIQRNVDWDNLDKVIFAGLTIQEFSQLDVIDLSTLSEEDWRYVIQYVSSGLSLISEEAKEFLSSKDEVEEEVSDISSEIENVLSSELPVGVSAVGQLIFDMHLFDDDIENDLNPATTIRRWVTVLDVLKKHCGFEGDELSDISQEFGEELYNTLSVMMSQEDEKLFENSLLWAFRRLSRRVDSGYLKAAEIVKLIDPNELVKAGIWDFVVEHGFEDVRSVHHTVLIEKKKWIELSDILSDEKDLYFTSRSVFFNLRGRGVQEIDGVEHVSVPADAYLYVFAAAYYEHGWRLDYKSEEEQLSLPEVVSDLSENELDGLVRDLMPIGVEVILQLLGKMLEDKGVVDDYLHVRNGVITDVRLKKFVVKELDIDVTDMHELTEEDVANLVDEYLSNLSPTENRLFDNHLLYASYRLSYKSFIDEDWMNSINLPEKVVCSSFVNMIKGVNYNNNKYWTYDLIVTAEDWENLKAEVRSNMDGIIPSSSYASGISHAGDYGVEGVYVSIDPVYFLIFAGIALEDSNGWRPEVDSSTQSIQVASENSTVEDNESEFENVDSFEDKYIEPPVGVARLIQLLPYVLREKADSYDQKHFVSRLGVYNKKAAKLVESKYRYGHSKIDGCSEVEILDIESSIESALVDEDKILLNSHLAFPYLLVTEMDTINADNFDSTVDLNLVLDSGFGLSYSDVQYDLSGNTVKQSYLVERDVWKEMCDVFKLYNVDSKYVNKTTSLNFTNALPTVRIEGNDKAYVKVNARNYFLVYGVLVSESDWRPEVDLSNVRESYIDLESSKASVESVVEEAELEVVSPYLQNITESYGRLIASALEREGIDYDDFEKELRKQFKNT